MSSSVPGTRTVQEISAPTREQYRRPLPHELLGNGGGNIHFSHIFLWSYFTFFIQERSLEAKNVLEWKSKFIVNILHQLSPPIFLCLGCCLFSSPASTLFIQTILWIENLSFKNCFRYHALSDKEILDHLLHHQRYDRRERPPFDGKFLFK